MPDAEPPTRVAIIGAGFGRYALAPAFRRDPRCEVVAVCTGSAATAAQAAARLGVSRWFGDVDALFDAGGFDAVAVATPPAAQPAVLRRALDRHVPVFAEKLLALSVADAQALTEAADAARVANVVDYIFPDTDAWLRARELVEAGAIGAVRHVAVSWLMESHDNRHGLATWKTAAEAGGGALQHFGPHVFYAIEWLVGPVRALGATLARAADVPRPGDTLVTASLSFADGATGSLVLSNAAPGGTGHRVEVVGAAGTLVLVNETADAVHGFRLRVRTRAGEREAPLPILPPPSREADARVLPVSRVATRFLDWIRDGRPARPSFRDALRVQRLLEAVARSAAADGRRIDLAP